MNVQATEQMAGPEFGERSFLSIGSKRVKYYQAFPAPFTERKALLILGDASLVVLAAFAAFRLWHPTLSAEPDVATPIGPSWYWLAVLLGGWWVVAWLMDLYHIPSVFDTRAISLRVAVVGIANLAIYLAIFFLVPGDLPRVFFLYLMLIVWPALIVWRWAYAAVSSAQSLQHRILIVGTGRRAQSIANLLEQSPRLNYRVIGHYEEEEPTRPESGPDGLLAWGQAHSLTDLVRLWRVHEVVVAIDGVLGDNLFSQLTECQANGIRVSLMPDLYERLSRRIPVEHIDPDWVLQVLQGMPVFSRLQLGLKRLMDLALGLAGLFVLALSLPFVALAIRLDSPGPIFYRQTRSGRAGMPFWIFKFRTMDVNAESDGRARWATEDDPRITRVGHYLRKSRLDELPQILNVLRGEMSFVGPRPERPELIADLRQVVPFYPIRLMVKPGLTGWAQVRYGYGNSVDDSRIKMQYDFYYLRNWSLWLDLYIIVQTVGVVFRMKGT